MQERGGLKLLGNQVCQKGFHVLVGIGKNRFHRLRHAASRALGCPTDLRFRPKQHETLPANSVRPEITEFLQELYHTTAEPLPEAYSVEVPVQDATGSGKKTVQNVRRRGKRPRHLYKFDASKARKNIKGHLSGAKFVPPGSITDYLEICRDRFPHLTIGRKVFCRDSGLCTVRFCVL